MTEEREPRVAQEDFERLIKQLVVTFKAVMLYPDSSQIPAENGEVAVSVLHELFARDPEVRIGITKEGFHRDEELMFPGHAAFTMLAQAFYHRGVAEIRFHAGVTAPDIVALLGLLRLTPMDIISAGGFESRLWEAQVVSITITESRVQILEETDSEGAEEVTAEDVQHVLESHDAGRPVEHRVLMRVAADSAAVRSYLDQKIALADGLDGDAVRELAHLAAAQPLKDRPTLVRALADALGGLDSDEKRTLIAEHVLPGARTDEALAAVIRQMDVDAVCHMLVEELEGGEGNREGVARALRNLALISMADRGEVMSAAGAAMLGAGVDEETTNAVLEMANPTVLTVRDSGTSGPREERPVETVFKLMDLAPLTKADYEQDPEFEALESEARLGVADAEVLSALVTLVTLDPESDRWPAVMSMLESSLEMIVSRGEFEIAADAAEQLRDAAAAEGFDDAQRARLLTSIDLMARPHDVRALAAALRVYEAGTAEYAAAHRLLDLLEERVIEPLIAVLADEKDMSTRKALVDLLAGFAPEHMARIGAYVDDSRWYLVRNIVTVLASPRSPAALPYLTRAARHEDARVRRETIRALAGISDRTAAELLVSMLSDDDPQNVQFAARSIGQAKIVGAVPMLLQVARGDGRGGRDTGARVEAIEALGQIGSPQAVDALRALGRRTLMGAGRSREVRSAAQTAVERIAVGGGVR